MSHAIFEMSLIAAAYFYILTSQHLTPFKYCIKPYAVQCCKLLVRSLQHYVSSESIYNPYSRYLTCKVTK